MDGVCCFKVIVFIQFIEKQLKSHVLLFNHAAINIICHGRVDKLLFSLFSNTFNEFI